MPAVFKTHNDWSSKIKTRDLNDWLALAIQRRATVYTTDRVWKNLALDIEIQVIR